MFTQLLANLGFEIVSPRLDIQLWIVRGGVASGVAGDMTVDERSWVKAGEPSCHPIGCITIGSVLGQTPLGRQRRRWRKDIGGITGPETDAAGPVGSVDCSFPARFVVGRGGGSC